MCFDNEIEKAISGNIRRLLLFIRISGLALSLCFKALKIELMSHGVRLANAVPCLKSELGEAEEEQGEEKH